MDRDKIIKICQTKVLPIASKLYGASISAFELFPGYLGATNIVYAYQVGKSQRILRVSYIPERTDEQILAEVDFVKYLFDNGAPVAAPLPSAAGILVEIVEAQGFLFRIVSFARGKGMRIPDNGYRYRQDAPIDEYFQNWGQVLGKLHRLAKDYQPPNDQIVRPGWFELRHDRFKLDFLGDKGLHVARQRIQATLDQLRSFSKEMDVYGLIHSDFTDGNFVVDFSNGNFTVFDFDDACYFWYVHELAAAWDGGIGRVMFEGVEKRKAFMDHYMAQVLEGYQRENTLSEAWLTRLPLFISLVQIDEFLFYTREFEHPDIEIQAKINYRKKCIEEQIPYMGFFDPIYSPEKPFSL